MTSSVVQIRYETHAENSKKGPAVHRHGNKQYILPNSKISFNLFVAIFTDIQSSGLLSPVCDLQSSKRFLKNQIFGHISDVTVLCHLSVNRQTNYKLNLTF